jgi:hypothetical protein
MREDANLKNQIENRTMLPKLCKINLKPQIFDIIIEQFASNKSCLLLKIQKQNRQTLQLFIKIIK